MFPAEKFTQAAHLMDSLTLAYSPKFSKYFEACAMSMFLAFGILFVTYGIQVLCERTAGYPNKPTPSTRRAAPSSSSGPGQPSIFRGMSPADALKDMQEPRPLTRPPPDVENPTVNSPVTNAPVNLDSTPTAAATTGMDGNETSTLTQTVSVSKISTSGKFQTADVSVVFENANLPGGTLVLPLHNFLWEPSTKVVPAADLLGEKALEPPGASDDAKPVSISLVGESDSLVICVVFDKVNIQFIKRFTVQSLLEKGADLRRVQQPDGTGKYTRQFSVQDGQCTVSIEFTVCAIASVEIQ